MMERKTLVTEKCKQVKGLQSVSSAYIKVNVVYLEALQQVLYIKYTTLTYTTLTPQIKPQGYISHIALTTGQYRLILILPCG